jgi:hypothetical protein
MCQERVRANLMFALERITHSFLCTMGEHKVRPYIGLVNKKMRNLLFKHSLTLFLYDLSYVETHGSASPSRERANIFWFLRLVTLE